MRIIFAFLLISTAAHASQVGSCGPGLHGRLSLEQQQRLKTATEIVQKMPNQIPVRWESRFVSANLIATPARAHQILELLFDSKSELNKELAAYNAKLRENKAAIWNLYLRLYDSLLIYCEGYKDIFLTASAVLPLSGQIGDYGYGTGNGSMILNTLSPEREMHGADISSEGNARTIYKATRLKEIFGTHSGNFEVRDLSEFTVPENSLDGALMNNVLYNIPEDQRVALLQKVRSHLKPGAKLVLNDPKPIIQKDSEKSLRHFVFSVLDSSLKNGSKLTEQELALIGFVNIQLLSVNKFLTSAELERLAKSAGFKMISSESSYYDSATLLVLQK